MTPRSGGRGQEVNYCKADEVFAEHGGVKATRSLRLGPPGPILNHVTLQITTSKRIHRGSHLVCRAQVCLNALEVESCVEPLRF
jgi:hypothetical protein